MTILISGACGFMGREVAAQAKSSGIDVVCGVDIAAGVAPYQPDFPLYANYADAPKADVVIDFSNWKPGANVLDYATKYRVPVVIASTGSDRRAASSNRRSVEGRADFPLRQHEPRHCPAARPRQEGGKRPW
ncbi:MAG: hypothetical protein V8R10_09365 [Christensenellales bacterium]